MTGPVHSVVGTDKQCQAKDDDFDAAITNLAMYVALASEWRAPFPERARHGNKVRGSTAASLFNCSRY